jgi:glycosyltransferase involved in cell wall biosynthesis
VAAGDLVLSVVIPVFDEAGAIRRVVSTWDDELGRLAIPYEIRVYDDGSRDQTGALLAVLARERPHVVALGHTNRGHGPTILRGYHEARGTWVFQVDGDDEMPASAFPGLWARRDQADLVLGYRVGRTQSLARRIVSGVSRATVRLLFGRGIRDVNVPYRLYRRSALQTLLPLIPDDTFAPNVALAGLAIRRGLRVVEMPVPHRQRVAGASSLGSWRLWRSAARALGQTVHIAWAGR